MSLLLIQNNFKNSFVKKKKKNWSWVLAKNIFILHNLFVQHVFESCCITFFIKVILNQFWLFSDSISVLFNAGWTFVAIFCLENPPQKSCLKRSNCKRNASRTLVAATKLLFDHQSSFCPFELKNWTTRAIHSETCAVFGNFLF